MNQGRIIVITGAPGTGKTTTASAVAKESDLEKSVHMHTDDFYHYLSKGAIPPHLPESNEQNLIVIEAFLEAAKRYARGGYDVIVDGIVGPWFLEPWLNIVQEHYEVHYIVLRASKEETMKRAIERSKLDRETNIEYKMDTKKLKLESLSGIRANRATFFSPNEGRSSSSVVVKEARLSRLNFSSLAASVICIDFKVLAAPE